MRAVGSTSGSVSALLLAATLSLIGVAANAATQDPRAVAVAQRSLAAMGGAERFAATRLLRFDWMVDDGKNKRVRHHWWDRHDGKYRVEGVNRDGLAYRVLFDVDDKQGRAWLAGRELAGEELAKLLESGYGQFINDTYWLLMPWKWLDPGVKLGYEGKKTVDGQEYEVVTLSFETGTGLTSNDRYWAYVSPASGLMERWEYVLETEEGAPGSAAPTAWAWESWQDTAAGIKLPTMRRRLGEGATTRISFPVAEARSDVTAAELAALFDPSAPAVAVAPPAPAPAPSPAPAATPPR